MTTTRAFDKIFQPVTEVQLDELIQAEAQYDSAGDIAVCILGFTALVAVALTVAYMTWGK